MPSETLDKDWLISVDDHVIEPPNLWTSRLPERYRGIGPRVEVGDDGLEAWRYEDKRATTTALGAAVGRTAQQLSMDGVNFSDMRAGCYDAAARAADMDRAGILASLCFPSFPRFCGQIFHEASDKELALLCVRAYNDWMIDEWCASAPNRFIPLMIIPLWDPRAAAAEMERCAGLGARGFAFSENPVHLNLPSIHAPSEYWRPVFETANDTGLVVCTHIGSSSRVPVTSPDAPAFVTQTLLGHVNPASTLTDWLFSGWFQELPNLKLALSEGGIGWMPYVLERSEYVLRRHRYWADRTAQAWANVARRHETNAAALPDAGTTRPVDYDAIDIRALFKDHVYGCFIDDQHGVDNIHKLGVDNIMLETDYPHSDSTWPDCIDLALKQIAGLSEEDQHKVLRGNAERVFRLTPPDVMPTRVRA